MFPADQHALTTDVYAALFLGALLIAAGQISDPFPADLELAVEYFTRFPPPAKA